MNHADAERIKSFFESQGLAPAAVIADADVFVCIMCSVRQMAVDRVFGLEQKIKNARKINPKLATILTGCVIDNDKPRFAQIFDYILDIKTLNQWPRILNCRRELRRSLTATKQLVLCKNSFSVLIPISEGCNNYCSYCIVPYTRGRLICRNARDIVNEVKNAVRQGAKEIWLLGQNVDNYYYKGIDFAQLLRLVNDIPGNFWIRFTSPHPKDFDDKTVLAMAQSQKITPYLNLPIQSGDDKVLKAMKRPYTVRQYKALVKKLRSAFKKYRRGLEAELALSVDVIVGFPGETKKQFQNTLNLFREIKYDMAYIAEYSPRPQTAAANLPDNISPAEKKRRKKMLNAVVRQTSLLYNKNYINKTVDVMVDSLKNGYAFGKTRNYKTVKFIANQGIKPGDIVKVKIVKVMAFGLAGRLIQC